MALSQRSLAVLSVLLEGDQPSETGEWNMFCPYHGDTKRSASLNVVHGVWNCHGCGRSGAVRDLIADQEHWNLDREAIARAPRSRSNGSAREEPTEAAVAGWHSALLAEGGALAQLMQRRGLTKRTIEKYEIGWDRGREAYTIPIRDISGELVNVRRYKLDPAEGRRKIWSMAGCGAPALWPLDQLDHGSIVICEGEWDALICIQNGLHAVTRTAAARVWKHHWSHLFTNKAVYVCHDADTAGVAANAIVASAMEPYARSITVVALPYGIEDKHGKDLTDFFLDGHTKAEFLELIQTGTKVESRRGKEDAEPEVVPVSITQSFDSSRVGHAMVMEATIIGKRDSFSVPSEVTFTCDVGAGVKCNDCAVKPHAGLMRWEIDARHPVNLEMVAVSKDKLTEVVWKGAGLVKCSRWNAEVKGHRSIEEVYVRSSIERNDEVDFTHRKLISVGTHDLQINQTVRFTGTVRPGPKDQANEFQAWSAVRPENALSSYAVSDAGHNLMVQFQPGERTPLDMAKYIANDLATSVTLLVKRQALHVFIDLVLHSGLEFMFGDERVSRGWLDGLVVGETRTGKSEAARGMIQWYGLGEMFSCESSSYAGVVGGLTQINNGGPWFVSWGVIPLNDRRAVILDEVSGLKPRDIGQMSSVRSDGVAEITKVTSGKISARTRLLWLSNPRDSGMDEYMYGVRAIKPLIGNPEDIARFDMAMALYEGDVSTKDINNRKRGGESKFGKEAYRELLKWAWTRTSDQIVWGSGAVELCKRRAEELGAMFSNDPPLIQGANVRLKLARIAVALAMRTYSTTNGHDVVVTQAHVQGAMDFLTSLYRHPKFGYLALSGQEAERNAAVVGRVSEIMNFIMADSTLRRLFSSGSTTDRQLSSALGPGTSAVVSKLLEMNAVDSRNGEYTLHPAVMAAMRKENRT